MDTRKPWGMKMLRDTFFFALGIGFLALAKSKNMLRGYSSPKPFGIHEREKCFEYDVQVVENWLSHLGNYTQSESFFAGKNVLELGPGSDLGVGIYLLAKGVAQYNACDVNDLEKRVPESFYEFFLAQLESLDSQANISFLRKQLHDGRIGRSSKINYVVRNDFDLVKAFGSETIELVFSQAAFEHFDDVEKTVEKLTAVCKPGAVMVAEIDLQTHSRWIRQRDPNNIYRYSDKLYKKFWFRGIPNRVRPFVYKEIFERYGWTDISIAPILRLDAKRLLDLSTSTMYQDEANQMDHLEIMFCARKRGTL